jgi:N-acetylmuramoyl-L-alanine amidase
MKKTMIFLIDSGHGGVINGVPQTAGKRSPDFGDGVLYEGVINRKIAKKVIDFCKKEDVYVVELVPEETDISLGERVRRANKYKNAVLISLHCNAATTEKANGWEIFTTVGQNNSDPVAEEIYKQMKLSFPKANFRTDTSDGDNDKEVDFFLIKKANCISVLVENFFMTNEKDYKLLMSDSGQTKIAKAIFEAIKVINK